MPSTASVWLATRFSYSGYWHWLFEGLVHAVRLDEEGILASLDRLVICFNNAPPRYVDESLEAVGIPCSKVSATSTPFDVAASELIVPERAPGFGGLIDDTETTLTLREIKVRNAQYGNDADVRAVRRRLGLDGAGRTRGRRLLVSRRDAAKRRVINEDALLSALEGLGFELVVPGTLSFSEQVATFSEAQLVVGPHGAGLANALFMPQGSAMLELHHPGFGRPYYRWLADTVGIRYQALACEPAPGSPPDMVAAVDHAAEAVRTHLTQIAH
jgi:Glycosyltransferase 61